MENKITKIQDRRNYRQIRFTIYHFFSQIIFVILMMLFDDSGTNQMQVFVLICVPALLVFAGMNVLRYVKLLALEIQFER
jgi:hypothetical protein